MQLDAQKLYSLDVSKVSTEINTGFFKMGNPGREGKEILINSRYLTKGGVPQIPVMGELQYSRLPRERWEDEILKMKACGVNIIATYSFWIHHEEIEGQFDFNGNKDLRVFVKMCQKLGVFVFSRIGPWSHGECRNGGTPDWILKKKYLTDRSLDPVYQTYVESYFKQIGRQLKGLMYKDSGPVVGIQLENEYWKGKQGEPYIMWLKKIALKNGLDVPLYTVTGWGDGSVPLNEVIPLWGGYPDESWAPNIEKINNNINYSFSTFRDDKTIGNAQVTKKNLYDYSLDPYFTCEMGVGIFSSIHRRPILGKLDGLGMIVSRIGSGGNLLGYYIFAGGSNPIGIYSTMEENKDETGYYSELSPISYDFQAAIKENGLLAPSYWEVKKMNYFLNEFGNVLAPMEPVFPMKADTGLQYAIRAKNNSGFLFGINYCRGYNSTEKKEIRFEIKFKSQTITFPSRPVTISDSSTFIWPLNMDLDGTKLVYATAQPLFKSNGNQQTWIFAQDADAVPELCFNGNEIDKVASSNGTVVSSGNNYVVSNLHPKSDCVISITKKNGQLQTIIIVSKEEAKESWILQNEKGEKQFIISRAGLYMKENQLNITDTLADMKVKILQTGAVKKIIENGISLSAKKEGLFDEYEFHLNKVKIPCLLKYKAALEDAEWLATGLKYIDANNLLDHKLFQKEFSANNPAKIKWAKLIIATESGCRFRINDKWCEQIVKPGELNVLDITGYISKGENILLLDFPVTIGQKAFAARILVEYFNTDRLDFSTDTSWLATESYYFPPTYGSKLVYPITWAVPEVVAQRDAYINQSIPNLIEYTVPVECDVTDGLNNLYLSVKYKGDRIAVRSGYTLIADNLNNNTIWQMDMKRRNRLDCSNLQLELRPWKDVAKMYFDNPPVISDEGKAVIESAGFAPEYKVVVDLQ